jgi:hypothetical protein
MILSESEADFLERFESKEYRPELLFKQRENFEIIVKHPMAI